MTVVEAKRPWGPPIYLVYGVTLEGKGAEAEAKGYGACYVINHIAWPRLACFTYLPTPLASTQSTAPARLILQPVNQQVSQTQRPERSGEREVGREGEGGGRIGMYPPPRDGSRSFLSYMRISERDPVKKTQKNRQSVSSQGPLHSIIHFQIPGARETVNIYYLPTYLPTYWLSTVAAFGETTWRK